MRKLECGRDLEGFHAARAALYDAFARVLRGEALECISFAEHATVLGGEQSFESLIRFSRITCGCQVLQVS